MDAQTLLDSLDAFAYCKDLEGNYTYANRAVQQLFGASLADIVGKDDSEFFDLERSNALRLNDQEVMSSGVSVSREERDVVAETGEELLFHTVKSPIRDASGNVIGMCGISVQLS